MTITLEKQETKEIVLLDTFEISENSDSDSEFYYAKELVSDIINATEETYIKRYGTCPMWFLVGSLGLWHGRIAPAGRLVDSIDDILRTDCDDLVITIDESNNLNLTYCHHDGRNNFKLYFMNESTYNNIDDEYQAICFLAENRKPVKIPKTVASYPSILI